MLAGIGRDVIHGACAPEAEVHVRICRSRLLVGSHILMTSLVTVRPHRSWTLPRATHSPQFACVLLPDVGIAGWNSRDATS